MAYNVFGNPITNTTLRGLPEYCEKQTITRTDKAHVALNGKKEGVKYENARQHVQKLKEEWGVGVSTLCLIYNATGGPVYYVTSHNYLGHIGPAPYPQMIANGQWAAFFHVKTTGELSGSTAAVVYRGKNEAGQECDWMLGWSNPYDTNKWKNMVYTEIKEANHFEDGSLWGSIADKMYQCGMFESGNWNGCVSYVSTESNTSPVFEATMTVKKA
ncbi:23 kDa jasmonate-induced protein-like [Diospyros lotus]|uniref:23 kDa jasmonate-induced protein-like n=1 Tax=Diospyros lotus TaxID=55363 RepID=UPI00225890B1|nr:23 kDa jasmonate-induced protein-like [Diospyros lotus]